MSAVYIKTKALPPSVVRVLSEVGYGCKDISVEPAETVSAASISGAGKKAFVAIVDGDKHVIHWGSWGGSNAFNPDNPVDLDSESRPLMPGVLVVRGCIGGGRPTYAAIEAHPDTLAPLLPAGASLDTKLQKALACFRCLKSSARPEYLERLRVTAEDLNALVAGGYLKRSKNGATRITTLGKNNAARNYY